MIKKLVLCVTITLISIAGLWYTPPVEAGNFSNVIDQSVNTNREINLFDRLQKGSYATDVEGIRDFIVYLAFKVFLPIMVWAGIVLAIVGFYKLMTANNDEDLSTAQNYILRGVLGVVIMVSAGYVINQLVGTTGEGGIIGDIINNGAGGGAVAEAIYVNIAFPFLRIFIYVGLGVLFLLLLSNGIKYIFSSDDTIQKKALTVVLYNTIGILVIILAKTIIEAVYGPYASVIKDNINNLGDIGVILDDPSAQFAATGGLYSVINWILGLVTFLVVVIIIYQGYLLLVNPTNEDNIKQLKRNMLYIFIGILIIGAGYLLTNFLIVT